MRRSLAFESISPGNYLMFAADGFLDGDDGSRLEYESRKHRTKFVNRQRSVTVHQHVPSCTGKTAAVVGRAARRRRHYPRRSPTHITKAEKSVTRETVALSTAPARRRTGRLIQSGSPLYPGCPIYGP